MPELSMTERLDAIFAAFTGAENELIPLLQAVQAEFGYLPEDAMLAIARFARVPESRVFGVATFYAQFRFTPIGRNHVMVCRGTACHVRGASKILERIERQLAIEAGQTTADGEFSLETVACIGACGLAPCLTINQHVAPKVTPGKVTKLLQTAGGKADDR